jgi:hypothetical protein
MKALTATTPNVAVVTVGMSPAARAAGASVRNVIFL